MNTTVVRSPSYPNMSLADAIEAVAKIEKVYRSSPVDREHGAKLIGYSGLSGPAAKALAALASFGLVERAGKGTMRVTQLARTILHGQTEAERRQALNQAAVEPPLFQDIRERFPDIDIPPEDGVKTYLNREGFNSSAVGPAARAFIETMTMLFEQRGANESHGVSAPAKAESAPPEQKYGGARVGDLIQWESDGVLRLDAPKRVRWISEDGNWLAVEGSETGIPMEQVIVESANPTRTPPPIPPLVAEVKSSPEGFTEWFRAKVGPDKLITINYKGKEEIGPREIEKMISILEAQKAALE